MGIEEEASALLKRWNAQQNSLMGKNTNQSGDPSLGTDQSPHLLQGGNLPTSPDQTPPNPINSVRPMGTPIQQNPQRQTYIQQPPSNPGNSPLPSQRSDVCKECGALHPPIPDGKKCPNASVVSDPNEFGGIDDMTINKHLVDIRNIMLAQITSKGIKDGKKFFQHVIIELTKIMESYNE